MAARMRRARTAITPFWNRMPWFFLYPLTPPGLYVLFGLAFINAVLLDVTAAGAWYISFVISIVTALFSVKYGYDVLERTAHGELTPPRLNRETLLEGYELPFKQLAIFILLGLFLFGVGLITPRAIAPLVVLPVAIAVVVLFPAIVMTLALERSVVAALNPATLFGIAFRVGWPYLAVLALLVLLNGGSATVMSLFGRNLPIPAFVFLNTFAQNLFWFAMMHLMGYLLYQYHDRLGFEPDALADADDGWGEAMAPVEEALDTGDYPLAAQRLDALARDYPDQALELRHRRHQILKLADDGDALIDNAGHLLPGLIDTNRLREATEVYIDITNVDRELRPAREGDFEPLLNMLVQRGEYRRAVRMVSGFHKSFPNSEMTPHLYLEIARLFSEELDQPAKVRQIAEYLNQVFPDHPATQRARCATRLLADHAQGALGRPGRLGSGELLRDMAIELGRGVGVAVVAQAARQAAGLVGDAREALRLLQAHAYQRRHLGGITAV